MRRWRTAAALTAGVAATALLTACTPTPEPVVGVAVRDGKPLIVVVSCPDYSSGASVYRTDEVLTAASPDAYAQPTWEVRRRTRHPSPRW